MDAIKIFFVYQAIEPNYKDINVATESAIKLFETVSSLNIRIGAILILAESKNLFGTIDTVEKKLVEWMKSNTNCGYIILSRSQAEASPPFFLKNEKLMNSCFEIFKIEFEKLVENETNKAFCRSVGL